MYRTTHVFMQTTEAWMTVCEAVEGLSEREQLSSEDRAFLLLYSNLGIQLISPSEREKAVENIKVNAHVQC